jgi:hypothetical protein
MSNYTKVTNFTAKDSLPPGNSGKVVRGSEIDTELNNVATAIATKTDNASANITGGTITGITDLAVADGGTGASNASGARTNLGLVIGTDVQAYDAQLADIAGLSPTDNGVVIGNGTNFVVESGATLKTSLGLTIGTDVQAYDAQLTDIAGLTPSDGNFIVGDGTNFVAESGATARTSLGLGSIATQASSNVTITGGSVTGITDLAVADGGTGASTAANARVNLLPSYTGNGGKVLAVTSGATDVEWITVGGGGGGTGDVTGPSSSTDNTVPRFDGSTGKIIQTSGVTINDSNEITTGAWKATEIAVAYGGTGASTLTGIIKGNGTSAFTAATAGTDYLAPAAIGTTVQAYDAQLTDVAGLAVTDGNFIVGNGTNFVAESGDTARTSLGVGTGDSPQFTAVNVGHATDTTITRVSAGVIAVEGSNVLLASNIGSTVQAYDAQLADVAGLTPTDNGVIIGNGTNFVVESGATLKTSLGLTIGTDVQAYDADTAKTDVVQTFTAAQSFNSGNLKLNGSSSGTSTLNAAAAAGTTTITLPAQTATLGYINIPPVGTKTGSYTLATTDVGEYVQVGSGGSITIPDATFAEGDAISIFNNTSGNITITCSITTAYIAGTDSDKASVTLATRGVCTILFISSTVCVITGNVS